MKREFSVDTMDRVGSDFEVGVSDISGAKAGIGIGLELLKSKLGFLDSVPSRVVDPAPTFPQDAVVLVAVGPRSATSSKHAFMHFLPSSKCV